MSAEEHSVPRLPLARIGLGFAGAAAVLAILLTAVEWGEVLAVLERADPGLVAVGGVAALGSFVCWSEALRLLFRASGAKLSVRECLVPYGAATFARMVLPVGQSLGPAMFVVVVRRRTERTHSEDLAPTTVGEVTNYVVSALLAIAGGLVVFGFAAPARQVRVVQVALATVLVGGTLVGGVLWYRRGSVRTWVLAAAALGRATVGRVSDRAARALAAERVDASVDHYYRTASAVVDSPGLLAATVAVSALGWVLTSLPLVVAAEAVGHPVPLALALFVVPPIGLLGFLPLPGALGGVEVALAVLLGHLGGVPMAAAAATVLLYRVCTYWLPLVVSGGVFTWVWAVGWGAETQ